MAGVLDFLAVSGPSMMGGRGECFKSSTGGLLGGTGACRDECLFASPELLLELLLLALGVGACGPSPDLPEATRFELFNLFELSEHLLEMEWCDCSSDEAALLTSRWLDLLE